MSGIGDKRARNEETREGGFSYKGSCRYKGLSLLCSKGNDIFRPEGGECHLLGNKGA